MAKTPSGSTFQLYTSLAAAKAVTAISNAAEAVVSAVAHGYANGEVIYIESGWGQLNRRAFRIKSVTTDSFVLEGANTTNTGTYPTGSGAGNAYKAMTPVQVTQVLASNSSGGEPKTIPYKYLDSDVEFSLADGFTAISSQLEIDADALGTPGYVVMQTLSETGLPTVLRTTLKGGSFTLKPGTAALNEEVILQDGQVNRVRAVFNASNRATRYAA